MSKEFSSQNIVLGTVAAIMLVLILTIVFFAIPVGVTLCSLFAVIYGIKSFSRIFLKWSVIFLVIGIVSVIYTIILMYPCNCI